MTLLLLIGLPLLGGIVAWAVARANPDFCRWATIATLLGTLVLAFSAWSASLAEPSGVVEFSTPWIPQFGIHLALFADGISLPLIVLSILISLLAVVVSWSSIQNRVGAFHFNVLWVLSGAVGVFLAADLFLFFVFWEVMVLPMAFLIAFWGDKERDSAATRFFIFTQLSGLLMLISIVGLAMLRAAQPGLELSFLYSDFLDSPVQGGHLLMLGFFLAFAVKLPVVPFHVWQADAYTRAPLGGTLILAGFLAKTGGYGIIRYCLPLFPDAASAFIPWAFAIGALTIVYGAMLAFGQTDAKRLVAFSSLSHMGFVLIGAFSGDLLGMQGALIFMISHGFATAALFLLVDLMEKRLGHRDIEAVGGLAAVAPRFAALTLFFILASLGLPASGNFVGELLVVVSAFQQHQLLGILIGFCLIPPAVYSLYFVQKVLHGESTSGMVFPELSGREYLILAMLAAAVLYLGLQPQGILDGADPAFQMMQFYMTETAPSVSSEFATVSPSK